MENNNLIIRDWQQKAVNGLDKKSGLILAVIMFVWPLFFLPITVDWFEPNKQAYAVIFALVLGIIFVFRFLAAKKYSLAGSSFDLPVLLLSLGALISAGFAVNRNFELVSSAVPVAALTLIYLLVKNTLSRIDHVRSVMWSMLGSGLALSLFALIQTLLFWLQKTPSASLTQIITPLVTRFGFLNPGFSPTGTPFTQTFFLAILIPIAIGMYRESKKNIVAVIAILIVGIACGAYQLVQNRPLFLDAEVSWKIASGAMGQSLTSAFVGVGGGDYVNAFTAFKPLDFNALPLWNLRFGAASSHYLQLLTTNGIIGFAAIILLVFRIFQVAKTRLVTKAASSLEAGILGAILLAIAGWILFPAPFLIIGLVWVLLACLTIILADRGVTAFTKEYQVGTITSPAVAYAICLGLLVGLGAITFFTAKSYIGNFFMARSLSFAAKNRGTDTYNAQIRAIDFDPDNDNYRVAYSQTNLALADTLAGQIAGASPSAATENQKATVVTLVQQSIREGRNAVALNPKRAANWENLSLIYRNLINFAQGADQWAAESLNQAVLLDPLNPRLRLELGNILVGGNNLTVAAQSYLNAVNLKSDYLPARYALAQILARLGDKENAKTQLTMIRDLVCKLENPTSSEDCRRIKADLATLETPAAKVTPQPTPTATSSGLISTPSATPKNLPKAKVTPVPVISSPSGELTN